MKSVEQMLKDKGQSLVCIAADASVFQALELLAAKKAVVALGGSERALEAIQALKRLARTRSPIGAYEVDDGGRMHAKPGQPLRYYAIYFAVTTIVGNVCIRSSDVVIVNCPDLGWRQVRAFNFNTTGKTL